MARGSAHRRHPAHESLRWVDVLGVAALGGIGFTVSLLIGGLAYGLGSERDLGPTQHGLPAHPAARLRRRGPRRSTRHLRRDMSTPPLPPHAVTCNGRFADAHRRSSSPRPQRRACSRTAQPWSLFWSRHDLPGTPSPAARSAASPCPADSLFQIVSRSSMPMNSSAISSWRTSFLRRSPASHLTLAR